MSSYARPIANHSFLIALSEKFNKSTDIDKYTIFTMDKVNMDILSEKDGHVFIADFKLHSWRDAGQRYGSRAMRAICSMADAHDVTLFLNYEPDPDFDFGFHLWQFYEKYGFEFVDEVKSIRMVRYPKPDNSPELLM